MSALLIGAVAYDPKVVTIWEGFRTWFRARDVDVDVVLYSNYERQVEDLIGSRIDVAWNSPLAWVRARRLAAANGIAIQAVAMRDTDRDLRSVVVVRTDSPIADVADLAGATIAVGAIDSPQARLLPLSALQASGVDVSTDVKVMRFDVGVGLHGDHIGGERQASAAVIAGTADAACLVDANLLRFASENAIAAGSLRILLATEPYDHCNFTAGPTAGGHGLEGFVSGLLSMSYGDESIRRLLDLEGLTEWLPGRTDRYAALERAVDELGFYGPDGQINADDYQP
jgi:ABC-type phosphate/phosphonate transport system substrate-binding protein